MVNDVLGDLITQIRNGFAAGKAEIVVPYSRLRTNVAQVLVDSGYLTGAKVAGRQLLITLKYQGKTPAVMGIRRISKPGARIYTRVTNLPRVWGGLGVNILSTPKGVMTDRSARKQRLGGEIICQVW